ncbi:MFS transporter [Streptomyces sp. NPDC056468]|uniref:MFS transporter n=1 Tax=Streptomyces sp. NPDC056468 TaxID=3345830 RepID=UPI00368E2E28
MTQTAPAPGGLLKQRDFRLFWTGDLVSQLGSEMTLFALPLVMVSTLDASGTQIGLLEAFYTLPFFLLPLFVGVWQERRARRPVMIATDLARFVLVVTIPVAAVLDVLSLAHVYVVAVLVGALSVVYDIAARSYLPRLVAPEHLGSANSKITADQAVSATMGPGGGGWLAGAFGAASVLFLDALSYLVSAVAMIAVRTREKPEPPPAERDLRRELAEGLRAVFGNPPVRAIALHAAIYNAGGSLVNVAFLVFFVRQLDMGTFAYGLVTVIGGIGAIFGAVCVPFLFERIGYGPSLLVALAFSTNAYFLLPLYTGSDTAVFWASAVGLFLGYAGSAAGSVIAVTVRQKVTPPELHARMNATYRLMNFGTIPVGAALAGVLVDGIGARTTLWLAPFVLLASVIPVANRTIWRLRQL